MLITDPDPIQPTDPRELPDAALIKKVASLTHVSRDSTAALIAHLVELERRNLHLACGFSSLYWYCRDVLRFSEPESYQRMQAAHVAARFPVILPLLADGRLHLAGLRLLAPHLHDENHLAIIGGALGRSKRKIEELLARWFPRPAIPASIRRVPHRRAAAAPVVAPAPAKASEGLASGRGEAPSSADPDPPALLESKPPAPTPVSSDAPGEQSAHRGKKCAHIEPLSATDYFVKFTANEEMIGRLRLAQELLSHSIPDGDIVEILDRGLIMVIAAADQERHAATARPRKPRASADPATRTISAPVQREVWARDDGQCAYVAADGRRCEERRSLQYHHLKPWAVGGPPSIVNIALRCRAHNQYEARVYFDPIRRAMSSDA